MAKKTQKIIGIVEDNSIAGIRYGEIEVPAETTNIVNSKKHAAAARAYAVQVKQIKNCKIKPKCRSN